MIKKTLFVGAILSSLAFTSVDYRNYNENYRETVNTLEDLQEWIVQDIQNGQVNQMIGETYLENIDQCLSRLEDLQLKTK